MNNFELSELHRQILAYLKQNGGDLFNVVEHFSTVDFDVIVGALSELLEHEYIERLTVIPPLPGRPGLYMLRVIDK